MPKDLIRRNRPLGHLLQNKGFKSVNLRGVGLADIKVPLDANSDAVLILPDRMRALFIILPALMNYTSKINVILVTYEIPKRTFKIPKTAVIRIHALKSVITPLVMNDNFCRFHSLIIPLLNKNSSKASYPLIT